MRRNELKPPSDAAIACMAQAHDLAFLALAEKSYYVRVVRRISESVTGLTAKTFLPSLDRGGRRRRLFRCQGPASCPGPTHPRHRCPRDSTRS